MSPTRTAANGFRRPVDRPCSSQALAGFAPALPAEAGLSRDFTGVAVRGERWSGFPPTLPFVFPKPPYGYSGTWPSHRTTAAARHWGGSVLLRNRVLATVLPVFRLRSLPHSVSSTTEVAGRSGAWASSVSPRPRRDLHVGEEIT